MLNTFENSQTTTSRRRERERQLELMNHAANGTGPFAADTLDSHHWDSGLDDIDESLMLDVEGAGSAANSSSPNRGKSYNDILSPDEARAAALAALRAADRDHYAHKAVHRSSDRAMDRSPDRFRWSPPNVPQDDGDFDIMEESLDDHDADLNIAHHQAYSLRKKRRWNGDATCAEIAGKTITRRTALIALLCLVAFLAMIIGVSVSASNHSDNTPSAASSSPTTVSSDEAQQRVASYMSTITSAGISSPEVFSDSNSPQYKALVYLSQHDGQDNTGLTADEKSELLTNRYGLLVLYYANIEPANDQQFIQGTPSDTPSSGQDAQTFDPNLQDDFRDSAADQSEETAPVDYTHQWLSNADHCTWTGVVCYLASDSDGAAGYGVVKSLNLTMRGLVGSIPEDVPRALNDLILLDLGYNKLTGNLPMSIGAMTYLEQLYLGGNQFEGSIPSTIGQLTFLGDLYLQENMLSGSIPTEIGKLAQLYGLGLYENNLKGSIPFTIGNLAKLYVCYLDDNALSGTIPSTIGQLSNLNDFRLRKNNLAGTIPPEIGGMTGLELFYLDDNTLTGSIPSTIGTVSKLRQLHLYKNSLGGSIPDALRLLENLELLYLDNNKLSGPVPATLGSLVHLESVYLFNNQLTGTLPASLGNLISLTNMRLNNNQFSGPIPSALGNLSKLQLLFMDTNDFSGTVPTDMGRLKRLEQLRLQGNKLTGSMPSNVCALRIGDLDELFADCASQSLTCTSTSCCTQCF